MTLHIEVPVGANAEELAQRVEKHLLELSEVEEVQATPESTRFVAETLAGIAITVSFIKGAGDLADVLHKVIPKIKVVLEDLGLRNPKAEVAGGLVPIDEANLAHPQ